MTEKITKDKPSPMCLTVRELASNAMALDMQGYGNKRILISEDDEGNGFHELFYAFIKDKSAIKEALENSNTPYFDENEFVLLG